MAAVDELWFEHAVPGRVLHMEVKLIPAEEMIWSKGLIMERERYDGADVAHVIHAVGNKLDWRRLLDRYGPYWRPLCAHLILFEFIYPSHRSKIPAWVMDELAARLAGEAHAPDRWGYKDAPLQPLGSMTAEQIARWTARIDQDGHT